MTIQKETTVHQLRVLNMVATHATNTVDTLRPHLFEHLTRAQRGDVEDFQRAAQRMQKLVDYKLKEEQ